MSEEIPGAHEYNFKENRLFDYVKKFSFPRLAGTEGEEKAVKLTEKTFQDLGYNDKNIHKESFKFSDFYSTTLIKLLMTINLTFYLILLLFVYIYPFVTILITIFFVIIIILIMRGLKHPEEPGFWGEYYGDILKATNVYTKVFAADLPEEEAGNIVISAHLDSKSQSYQTAWRVVVYRIWLFGGIALGIFFGFFLLEVFSPLTLPDLFLTFGIWTSTLVVSFSNVVLMFLNTHNKSPGAIDNASGMAIVFELSSYFRDNPLSHYNLWFVQFSAEELGTMGSRIFLLDHEDEFEKGKVYQINMDMVSSAEHSFGKNRVEYLKSYGVIPRRKIAPILAKYMEKAAEEEGVEINGFHLTTGAHLDSVAFHQRGFDAIDITTRAAARWAHSENDTPDKVDPKVLRDTCIIVKRTILQLDKEYNKLCNVYEG
ncbi:MAG: membrane protein of unknown function [Promethearchaeota archaeon]|nr:MAG: membrane protein of unknown function [Candidatus Lokiarchaeota archaeon]